MPAEADNDSSEAKVQENPPIKVDEKMSLNIRIKLVTFTSVHQI